MTRPISFAESKRGSALLHQQCWFWGHDVRRPEGNLLLHSSFQRSRPPAGIAGSSQYSLTLSDGFTVRLWGFGIFFGQQNEGIFLNRYEFAPRFVKLDWDVWEAHRLSRLPRVATTPLLVRAVEWLAMYEECIQQEFGTAYRATCLLGWRKRGLTPRGLVLAWKRLARDLAAGAPERIPANVAREPAHELVRA